MGTKAHPQTFIFSLYGAYVLPRGGEVWIGSLIQALAVLGFSEGAVRALVSRMQGKGLIRSRRLGRRSFYRLTHSGLAEVRWGGDQAFSAAGKTWDEHWTLVCYSIPETQRARRDALRRLLTGLGFGALAPGTWISPHPPTPKFQREWQELGVGEYLEVFRADHWGTSDVLTLVSRAWPRLPEIGERYEAYVSTYAPILLRFEVGALDHEICFAARLQSLVDFVSLTLADPALPQPLLPEAWPHPRAQELFKRLQRELAKPAERYFDSIYEEGGLPPSAKGG